MIDINSKIKETTKDILDTKIRLGDTTKLKLKLDTYRLIKAKETEFKTAKNAKQMDDTIQVNMLRKMVKEREETAKIYRDAGRIDLAEKETAEAMIIKELLPEEISEETIEKYVSEQFMEISQKDMGFRIKCVKDKFPTADGAVIAKIVRKHIK